LASVEAHENSWVRDGDTRSAAMKVQNSLDVFVSAVPPEMTATVAALQEFAQRAFDVLESIDAVAGMERFGALFGRETAYLSVIRRQVWVS
jgi:hypothetical protein